MPPHALSRRLALAAPALFSPMLRPGRASAQDRALRVVAPWTYDTPDPVDTGYVLVRLGIGETLVTVEPDGSSRPRRLASPAVETVRRNGAATVSTARRPDRESGSPRQRP